MASRKSQKNNVVSPHPDTALFAADSFRSYSRQFTDALGPMLNDGARQASKDIGGLIASATMLSLALELYLKALRIIIGCHVPSSHDLWSLYKGLPREVKAEVESRFEAMDTENVGVPAEVHIAIWSGGKSPYPPDEEVREITKQSKYDLKSILKRSKDAFITWRYLHEGGIVGEFTHFRFEHNRLNLICSIIQEMCKEALILKKAAKMKATEQ